MHVLLTGGSGFVAAHIIDGLLSRGHTIITTVRSQEKIDAIKAAHPNVSRSNLDFYIVEDIAKENAFDECVKNVGAGLDAVVHTASPFHFNVTDIKKDLLDPAVIGTTSILHAIKNYAPSVKRVVITSSFGAIDNPLKGNWPGYTYSEADWSPITLADALNNPPNAYRASKAFAERAAWDFLEKEKPNFTLATINPPLAFGPIVHCLNSLDALNTSNQLIRNILQGKCKDELPDMIIFLWVDVRDLALAHIRAIEIPDAGDKRFFITEGYFSNREIVEIVRKNFPEYAKELPGEDVKGGGYPEEGLYKFDNSRAVDVLGLKFRGLEESVVATVKSLKEVGI